MTRNFANFLLALENPNTYGNSRKFLHLTEQKAGEIGDWFLEQDPFGGLFYGYRGEHPPLKR